MKSKKVILVLTSLLMIFSAFSGAITISSADELQSASVRLYQNGQNEAYGNMSASFGMYMSSPSTAEEALLQGLQNVDDSIDLSAYGVTKDSLIKMYGNVINSCPELFYLDGSFGYRTTGTRVVSVMPGYTMSKDQIAECKIKWNAAVEKLLACIPSGATNEEKVLAVHDYIALHTEYDLTYSKFSAYDVFVDGTAVCQGYALAFNYIMDLLNIENKFVSSDSMNHGWSLVNLDGSWYHVDVTWDDPVDDFWGRVCHKYLLISDSVISDEQHNHSGWSADIPAATSDKYSSFFWVGVESAILENNGLWYFVGETDYLNNTVETYNFDNGAKADVFSIRARWGTGSGGYWMHTPYLATYGGRLYYNTESTVMSCDFNGSNAVNLNVPVDSGLQIYEMKIIEGVLYYRAKSDINGTVKVEKSMPIGAIIFKDGSWAEINRLRGFTLITTENISVEQFKNNVVYCDNSTLKIYRGDVEVTGGNVGTGMSVVLSVGGNTTDRLEIIVVGDTNGDGDVSSADVLLMVHDLEGKQPLEGDFLSAADTDNDGIVSLVDIMCIRDKLVA